MSFFCKHKWGLISETVTTSAFEDAVKALAGSTMKRIVIPPQLCDSSRKVIQLVSCDKCGKFKKLVERLY